MTLVMNLPHHSALKRVLPELPNTQLHYPMMNPTLYINEIL